jgi:acyl carrier protein
MELLQGASEADHEPKRYERLGWRERLETTLRGLAASWLGVPATWLRADVSFEDDLAMTPLDVTELAVATEQATGVGLAEDAVESVRTYGDFVERVVDAHMSAPSRPLPRIFVRASLVSARRDRHPVLLRSFWLSPYAVETLVADARRAGPGARLDVVVPGSASLAAAQGVERCFASLADYGVTVRVQHARLPHARAVA